MKDAYIGLGQVLERRERKRLQKHLPQNIKYQLSRREGQECDQKSKSNYRESIIELMHQSASGGQGAQQHKQWEKHPVI